MISLIIVIGCGERSRRADTVGASRSQSKSINVLPECPDDTTETARWERVTTVDRRLTLRLPPGGKYYPPLVPGDAEYWSFPNGSISYAITGFDAGDYVSKRADRLAAGRGWCNARIDGKLALVEYNYAVNAIGAGQFLQVFWPLDERQSLLVLGFWSDTTHASVLLEVSRSMVVHALPGDS
jgi:hypothetical protein